MSIPDAAIQAAGEAIDRVRRNRTQTSRELADAAIEAAMPAIREALAQEIEAATKPPNFGDFYDGCSLAALIVRGGAR